MSNGNGTVNAKGIETVETNRSATLGKLADALAKAQGEMVGASKDSVNPHFQYKYADLASVWEACRLPLSKNGLAVTQIVGNSGNAALVESFLMHSSGEWIMSRLSLRPVKDDPQGIGSAITYARRYALAALVGVSPEDDDGNAASGLLVGTTKPTTQVKSATVPVPTIPVPKEQSGSQAKTQTPRPELPILPLADTAGAVTEGQSVPNGASEPAAPVESPKAMSREEFRALAATLASHGLGGTQAKALLLLNNYIARCDGKSFISEVAKENAQKIARLLAHQLERDGPGLTVASVKSVLEG